MARSDSTERFFLQILWDFLREWNCVLRSPFFPVLFSLTVYLGCCFPYICLDLLDSRSALVRRFKIQRQRKFTWKAIWRCLSKIFHNHVCFIFPLSAMHWYWNPGASPPTAPAVLSVVTDILACLLLFDMQYFFWHLLHHKVHWLYCFFHKEHHFYTAPFSLATEDTGVWEMLTLLFFAMLNPALLNCHPLTEMLFFISNMYLSVEAHSGYEFPWSPQRLVPFGLYGGAQHHDLHHLKFKVNYAPYFTHWDRLFGTLHKLKKSRNTEA